MEQVQQLIDRGLIVRRLLMSRCSLCNTELGRRQSRRFRVRIRHQKIRTGLPSAGVSSAANSMGTVRTHTSSWWWSGRRSDKGYPVKIPDLTWIKTTSYDLDPSEPCTCPDWRQTLQKEGRIGLRLIKSSIYRYFWKRTILPGLAGGSGSPLLSKNRVLFTEKIKATRMHLWGCKGHCMRLDLGVFWQMKAGNGRYCKMTVNLSWHRVTIFLIIFFVTWVKICHKKR